MAVVSVGSLTLGQAVPLALEAQLALDASIGLVLPSLQARLAGLLELQAKLTLTPPSLTASLDIALKLVAALEASIALGMPGVSFQLSAVAALIAQIELDIGALTGHLALSASLALALGAGGVHAYSYSGQIGQLGNGFQTVLASGLPGGSPTTPVNGLLLVTDLPATWGAMSQVFKTSP